MNLSQLRPAHQLAQNFGVKSIIYGGPGSGKTPLSNTLPNPVLMVVEPGMMSMRNSNVPSALCDTPAKIDDFMKWAKESSEAKKFDTIAIDSISQMAELFLERSIVTNKHGMAAYGEMATDTYEHLRNLFYMPQKHVYLIAKEGTVEIGGIKKKRPYFPGQELNVKVPHLFDEIWHIGLETVPGQLGQVSAIRSRENFDCVARDRSGMLNELEPPHIGNLISKIMSQR